MKSFVIILCVCLVQLCLGSNDVTHEKENHEWKQLLQDDIMCGASEQFADDVTFVLENMENNTFIQKILAKGFFVVLSRGIRGENNSKMNVESVRDHVAKLFENEFFRENILGMIDSLKVIQLVLSQNLPPKRHNGLMNLCFLLFYPNVTTEEIENTLGYLYGTVKKPTLINIPDFTAVDCPIKFKDTSETIDKLKSMVDIKQKVIKDSTTIRDKFPCNFASDQLLDRFMFLMTQLQGDQSKITACAMERNLGMYENLEWRLKYERGKRTIDLEQYESILSSRLSDETFRGIMNFIQATKNGTTMDQIQMALEYLYDDIPTTKCEVKTE